MKRLIFAFMAMIILSSCSTDDNLPTVNYELAEITDNDFPEFFEAGKTYDLKMTYKLPSTCHNFLGFDGQEDPSTNEIFIFALTSVAKDATACDSSSEEALVKEGTLRNFNVSINVEEGRVYTFNLWTGKDSDGEAIYQTVEVPVGISGV